MAARSPHHTILLSLLEKKQFDACQTTVEDLIAAEMAADAPGDLELAHLYLFLCRAHQGNQQFGLAAEKADIAAVLAQKGKDQELVGEALYRSGFNCIQSGDYPKAIDRFTTALGYGDDMFKAQALYNRGHAHERLSAFSEAIQDVEEVIRLVGDTNPELVRTCRINLAWDLIMNKEFDKAEEVMALLANSPGAESDKRLQLQLAHDRVHMLYLKGEKREAVKQAVLALAEAGKEYPHINARFAQTLMLLAADQDRVEEAFILGILAKRLAGRANRLDIDKEISSQMYDIELQNGSEELGEALVKMGEIGRGALKRRPRRGVS